MSFVIRRGFEEKSKQEYCYSRRSQNVVQVFPLQDFAIVDTEDEQEALRIAQNAVNNWIINPKWRHSRWRLEKGSYNQEIYAKFD